MDNNNNRDQQFQMTPAVIEANRKALQQLPLEELNEMFRIQEGRDSSDDPQPVVGRVSRADKKKLIDRIMENMVKTHHPITEERYQFVLWLYRIRTQYPQMGLFQPDFIWVIFRNIMPSKCNRSDSDIKKAVNDWCEDPTKATAKYGHISKWNTSLVTDMSGLFEYKIEFNDDISKWNVSNVTDMGFMFSCYIEGQEAVSAFNGDISKWNVSKVTNMKAMFQCAVTFNGDISGWDVSSVTNMENMFNTAVSFNGDLSGWDVSNVTDMSYMFDCYIPGQEAISAFNGDISKWNVSKVTNMKAMFQLAVSFDGISLNGMSAMSLIWVSCLIVT
jgi:surface protein